MSGGEAQLLLQLKSLTPKEVDAGLNELAGLLHDIQVAWAAKLADIPADLQVGIDITGLLAGLPVVGPDMKLANMGLAVAKFVVSHGTPHNSGEGGIGADPAGNGNVTIG